MPLAHKMAEAPPPRLISIGGGGGCLPQVWRGVSPPNLSHTAFCSHVLQGFKLLTTWGRTRKRDKNNAKETFAVYFFG